MSTLYVATIYYTQADVDGGELIGTFATEYDAQVAVANILTTQHDFEWVAESTDMTVDEFLANATAPEVLKAYTDFWPEDTITITAQHITDIVEPTWIPSLPAREHMYTVDIADVYTVQVPATNIEDATDCALAAFSNGEATFVGRDVTRVQIVPPDAPESDPVDEVADGVPDDAGEYRDGLAKILRRIPPRWGRYISVRAGWYPLIIALDEELAAIEPDYGLCQVKEKFGGLRYYLNDSFTDTVCCVRWALENRPPEPVTSEWEAAFEAHMATPECEQESAATAIVNRKRRAQMETIIRDYENRAVHTCEQCGKPGTLRTDRSWLQTLCEDCNSE